MLNLNLNGNLWQDYGSLPGARPLGATPYNEPLLMSGSSQRAAPDKEPLVLGRSSFPERSSCSCASWLTPDILEDSGLCTSFSLRWGPEMTFTIVTTKDVRPALRLSVEWTAPALNWNLWLLYFLSVTLCLTLESTLFKSLFMKENNSGLYLHFTLSHISFFHCNVSPLCLVPSQLQLYSYEAFSCWTVVWVFCKCWTKDLSVWNAQTDAHCSLSEQS